MHFLKVSDLFLPHGPRNGQGKNVKCPVINPAMGNCEMLKMGRVISHE